MKTKLSLIVAIAITSLNAEVTTTQVFTNPLGSAFKSTDNGGTLHAIDAYKDGVGVVVLDNLSQGIQIDNSAMNTLVYKYGEAAKASGSTIVDEVMYGSGTTNTKDKVLVGKLTVDGAACNDQNAATQGETWLSGNCQGGISTNGTPCNDGDPKTITDIYTNGVCAGTNVEGQSCTDDNFLTIQDKYIDGVCVGTLTANGQTCNDSNVMTINDIYTNGVCAGTLTVNGQSCSDGLVMTVNDIYTNGVCAGTLTVNGQTCNDNNVATYADKYTNGVCAGVTNGTACNDGIATTYADKYTNGVCAGVTNGTTCSDGNAATYGDIYTNGVCAGFTNGTTCNDNNSATYNDIYTNGVCGGTLALSGSDLQLNAFVGKKADFTTASFILPNGGNPSGLFNSTIETYGAAYLVNDAYMTFTISQSFRLWTYYAPGYPTTHCGNLRIINTATNQETTSIISDTCPHGSGFNLQTGVLPAGTYKFLPGNGSSINSEWVFEKI